MAGQSDCLRRRAVLGWLAPSHGSSPASGWHVRVLRELVLGDRVSIPLAGAIVPRILLVPLPVVHLSPSR
eukprot:6193904-Pyramimonas_sp.AAC.1